MSSAVKFVVVCGTCLVIVCVLFEMSCGVFGGDLAEVWLWLWSIVLSRPKDYDALGIPSRITQIILKLDFWGIA